MTFATYSYGTRNGYSINTGRPYYKVGKSLTAPTVTGRDAPNKTGSAAQPMLVTDLTIHVNGSSTTSATTRFALWASNGTSGYFTDAFDLPSDGGTNNASAVTRTIVTDQIVNGVSIAGRPCFGGVNYIIGFVKTDTSSFIWDEDNSKAGYVIQDSANSSTTGEFADSGNVDAGSLVFSFDYDVLPTAPTMSTISATGDDITITWAAVGSTGGTAVTGYRIQRSLNGGSTWTTIVADTQSTSRTYTDSNQAYGATYSYRVAAINAVALAAGSSYSGPYSGLLSVTLSAVTGNATSTLTINASSTDAPLTIFSNGDSGIPFDAVEISYGSEKLYTRVTAQSVSTETTLQLAEALGSQEIYGIRSLDVSSLLNKYDSDVKSVASNLLYEYYLPDLRIESISINLQTLSEAQIVTLLDLEIDSALQVEFTPKGIGDPIVSVGRIIGIDHEIDIVSHRITIRMQDAINNIFTLDSDRFGILDTNPLG
jgi:hypothetical protein